MLQEMTIPSRAGVRRLGFSGKIWNCLERSDRQQFNLHRPSDDELCAMLSVARQTMDLASDDIIASMRAANPDTIRIASLPGSAPEERGIVALLPLNEDGAQAIVSNAFSSSVPQPEWISTEGVQPEAIYVWLIYMPGSFGRMLTAFADALETFLVRPVPVFSRAVSEHSRRLQLSSGYIEAKSVYPGCASDLLVVLPEKQDIALKPKAEVTVARTIEDIFQVFSVRSATYIAEQFCLYSEEFDGNDFCSTHWLGKIDGDAAGCIRARFFGEFAKIERLAVRAEYRNSRLAYQLVRAAIEHCRKKGYRTLYGHSRLDLQRFWKVFGFKPISDRPELSFANVKYVEMRLDLPPANDVVSLSSHPMHILRPEGAWDRPGPFEATPTADNSLRQALLAQRTRTVRRAEIVA
jgi:predicted GNAT family N-acyltransferase